MHEPADGVLDDPSAFDHGEAFDLPVLGGDFDIDAETGAVLIYQATPSNMRSPTLSR